MIGHLLVTFSIWTLRPLQLHNQLCLPTSFTPIAWSAFCGGAKSHIQQGQRDSSWALKRCIHYSSATTVSQSIDALNAWSPIVHCSDSAFCSGATVATSTPITYKTFCGGDNPWSLQWTGHGLQQAVTSHWPPMMQCKRQRMLIHCYNWVFCSGTIFEHTFTCITLFFHMTFCGGVNYYIISTVAITPFSHQAFCGGANQRANYFYNDFNDARSSVTIILSWCSKTDGPLMWSMAVSDGQVPCLVVTVQTLPEMQHCYNWVFCSGTASMPINFSYITPFFNMTFCGGVNHLITIAMRMTKHLQPDFCGGVKQPILQVFKDSPDTDSLEMAIFPWSLQTNRPMQWTWNASGDYIHISVLIWLPVHVPPHCYNWVFCSGTTCNNFSRLHTLIPLMAFCSGANTCKTEPFSMYSNSCSQDPTQQFTPFCNMTAFCGGADDFSASFLRFSSTSLELWKRRSLILDLQTGKTALYGWTLHRPNWFSFCGSDSFSLRPHPTVSSQCANWIWMCSDLSFETHAPFTEFLQLRQNHSAWKLAHPAFVQLRPTDSSLQVHPVMTGWCSKQVPIPVHFSWLHFLFDKQFAFPGCVIKTAVFATDSLCSFGTRLLNIDPVLLHSPDSCPDMHHLASTISRIQYIIFRIHYIGTETGWHLPELLTWNTIKITWAPLTSGTPGPNSGHSGYLKRLHSRHILLASFALAVMDPIFQSGGEGCVFMPPEHTEAEPQWITQLTRSTAKHGGSKPKMCYGTHQSHCTTQVVKRSLLRACRRAIRLGSAWYKGQCLQASDFPDALRHQVIAADSPAQSEQPKRLHHQNLHVAKKRLKILTWNPGGLSLERFDEARNWFLQIQADVVIMPETRWRYTQEWQDLHWNCVHSGDPDRPGTGIMCLISRRLQKLQQLRWIDLIPGRILHVRLHFTGRCVDVIGCYQYTNSHNAQRMQERSRWWKALDDYLQQLPRRNLLALAGDFNCCTGDVPSHVGSSAYTWNHTQQTGASHNDQGCFADLIRRHGLIVLNSWDSSQGPTYVKGLAHSRIDHILVRKQNADGGARSTKHIWNAPFLSPKPEGHAPVFAHIPYNWHPMRHMPHGCGVTTHQRLQGRSAWIQGHETWDEFMSQSTLALQQRLAEVPASDTTVVEHMNDELVRCFRTAFQTQYQPKVSAWTSHGHDMHTKWHHRNMLQRLRSFTLHSIFCTWHHAARYACLRRQHKQNAYAIRKARFHELLEEATHAASCHDSFRLFSVINKYAPKTARRRMQLRNATGTVATPQEELAILKSYVATKWHGPDHIPCQWSAPPGVPFDVTELERAISLIPCNKSVAFPYAPGLAWREHASTIAGPLFLALESWWSIFPPVIPQTWRDGWLILIPKPNKAPTAPKQLRPLALQEPIGKCILGLITQKAQQQTYGELCQWPLWAYLSNRSTLDALMHVCNHCKQVRSLIHSQRPTAFHRRQHHPKYKVCGGLQLFVDIDNAFDAVNREKLFGQLHQIGLTPNLIALLTAWHCSTSYHIMHLGEDHPVVVGRGLRQGCRAAPYLWNCFITLCLHRLALRLDRQFIREHITIFADDMHVAGIYHDVTELAQLNIAFGIFLDTLREFDLTVNPNKTFILIAMTGTSCRKAWADLTRRDSAGTWVKIKMPDDTVQLFPVVKSLRYLGAVVSYGQLED